MIFLCFLSHPLLSFVTFSSAYLSFYVPEDSNILNGAVFISASYLHVWVWNSKERPTVLYDYFFLISSILLVAGTHGALNRTSEIQAYSYPTILQCDLCSWQSAFKYSVSKCQVSRQKNVYQERCFFCISSVCTITNKNADTSYLLPTHVCASLCDFAYSGRLSSHGDTWEKVASVWRLAELEGHEAVQV